MDLILLKSILEEIHSLNEQVRNQRQDLKLKPFQPHKQQPYRKLERRAVRELGTKRRRNKAAYNAAQRDRYKKSRTGVKSDGKKGTVKKRKVLGSILGVRKPLRTVIR